MAHCLGHECCVFLAILVVRLFLCSLYLLTTIKYEDFIHQLAFYKQVMVYNQVIAINFELFHYNVGGRSQHYLQRAVGWGARLQHHLLATVWLSPPAD